MAWSKKAGDKINGGIMETEILKCNLCGENIPAEHDGRWTLGHNPDPLITSPDDRCCGTCNDLYVTKARIWGSTGDMHMEQIRKAIQVIRGEI